MKAVFIIAFFLFTLIRNIVSLAYPNGITN
ncbi:hypothetical protein VPHPS15B6_0024 [Vibrio phage PS15B-6]